MAVNLFRRLRAWVRLRRRRVKNGIPSGERQTMKPETFSEHIVLLTHRVTELEKKLDQVPGMIQAAKEAAIRELRAAQASPVPRTQPEE
jgi:hypothetical protein